MASPILRGGDLIVTEAGIRDAVRDAPLLVRERGEHGGADADKLGARNELVTERVAGAAADLPGGAGLVVLDTAATPELEAEGWRAIRSG